MAVIQNDDEWILDGKTNPPCNKTTHAHFYFVSSVEIEKCDVPRSIKRPDETAIDEPYED